MIEQRSRQCGKHDILTHWDFGFQRFTKASVLNVPDLGFFNMPLFIEYAGG